MGPSTQRSRLRFAAVGRHAGILLALASTQLSLPAAGWCAAGPKSLPTQTPSQNLRTTSVPVSDRRITYTGEVWGSVANDGTFGTFHQELECDSKDMAHLKITYCPGLEFPGGSRVDFLWHSGLCIGGIIGADTLVTSGIVTTTSSKSSEYNGFALIDSGVPEGYPGTCDPRTRRLDQTYTCVFYDTSVIAGAPLDFSGRPHEPLGLQIRQVTHQSADDLTRRFIIYDLEITNILDRPIDQMWFGVLMDFDVYRVTGSTCESSGWEDDIIGFLPTWPNPTDPRYIDSLLISWSADNEGDACGSGRYPQIAPRAAAGVRILRVPEHGVGQNYNWFTTNYTYVDWGPRLATDLRDFGTGGTGMPPSDAALYHVMANGERDYGQLYTALDYRPEWRAPLIGAAAHDVANGFDTRFLHSIGPLSRLEPGESAPFTFAFILGGNLHFDPTNVLDPNNPQQFVDRLDFEDLATNAWWAGYIWDNYGVDTDGDGYAGEYHYPVIGADTVYYTGDGCPDLVGPAPPACPDSATGDLNLISRPGELLISWSGRTAELEFDHISRTRDFEGWKVYVAQRNSVSDRPTAEQYSLIAAWDRVDYARYTYDPFAGRWRLSSHPQSVAQWRKQFGDAAFDPESHRLASLTSCYKYNQQTESGGILERCAYFVPMDANHENEYMASGETLPNLIQRVAVRDSIVDTDTVQYGEYELRLKNLLPSRYYFVSVTTHDFGDAFRSLEPQGCRPGGSGNVVIGLPIYSADVVEEYSERGGAQADSVRVSVYPNPYKISFADAAGHRTSYFHQGFEGRHGQESLQERDRRIHFINVPSDATISIYTLDGDLVRILHHPDPHLSGYSSEISWDLISRNTQAVTSGIYIYRVDSRLGTQVGKIVIIK